MSDIGFLRRAIAEAISPPPRIRLSEWAEKYRVVPNQVSANHGRWRNDVFPFLNEIMDCLCPWHPAETVTFMKSAQVGGTEAGLNWMMAIADIWAAAMMMVHPTIQAAQSWVREKLSFSLRATERVRKKVVDQKSRDGSSTTLFKQFDGGYWVITGANSAADISSKSVRFVMKEEWDRWPLDVDGQGDPDKLVNARQISYHASGQAKTFQPSTPTRAGVSRVSAAYHEGDQREYHVPCPHCQHMQALHFFPDNGKGGLIFDKENPEIPRYACESCGVLIDEYHKPAMLAGGKWIPKNPGPGRQPSFHISALYSPVTTWSKMAKEFLDSKDDPQKLVTFYNLWLGLPFEDRGDAPDWQRLMALREYYPLRMIPAGGLVITGGADVQAAGIYYEVVAWGPNRTSWSIDYGYLEGDTADAHDDVWKQLDAVFYRLYRDAYGNHHSIDAFGIDAGFNTGTVYTWTRKHQKRFAVKGMPGWMAPPIGLASKQDIDYRGQKIKNGVLLWPVGTWSLKSTLYANLRKAGQKETGEENPPGYCHFSLSHDEHYFKQLTSESIVQREVKGRKVREWVASGPNHLHDCRIYNMAMAEYLHIGLLTDEEWVALAISRNAPPPKQQQELFDASLAVTPKSAPSPVKDDRRAENHKHWSGPNRSLWGKR